MTATTSDVLAAANAAAGIGGSNSGVPRAPRVRASARARGNEVYRSLSVPRKIRTASTVMAADIRRSWWVPESLPTVRQAWAQRLPDRARVPAENRALHAAWVAYNHTLPLVVAALATALVGALTIFTWAAQHPARLLLAALVAVPLIVLVYG